MTDQQTDRRAAAASALREVPVAPLIDGEWHAADSDRTFGVTDPATGEVIAHVADAGPAEAIRALDAAAAAQASWAQTSPRQRSEVLGRALELLLDRSETLATLISLEMGKPLRESYGEVSYAADFLRWYSEEAVRINGRTTTSPNGGSQLLTVRRPVGPCLFITPWNFPLAMGARKLAAALAAGCTTVIKPAPQTPLSMLALGAILEDAGVPDGVVNMLPTSDAARLCEPLFADRRLRKLSFTGSTEVGRRLLSAAAGQILRTSMELGGNAPFLVFDDADLDAAVEGAMVAKLRNMGQACTSANRFLVHEGVADEFAHRLTCRMASLQLGSGLDESTDIGPLIDEEAVAKVERLVADAVARGSKVLLGGAGADTGLAGTFYPPTVLVDVPTDAHLASEEIFGPVAPIYTFASDQEAITLANATDYGLVAYAFTDSSRRMGQLGRELETGMLGLNQGIVSDAAAPFGGIKHSGFGREGGPEGLEEYLDTTYIAMPLT